MLPSADSLQQVAEQHCHCSPLLRHGEGNVIWQCEREEGGRRIQHFVQKDCEDFKGVLKMNSCTTPGEAASFENRGICLVFQRQIFLQNGPLVNEPSP